MTCLSIEHRRNVHGMISSAAHVHAFAQEAHPMQLQLCVGLHHDANHLARPCHHKSSMDLLSLQSNRELQVRLTSLQKVAPNHINPKWSQIRTSLPLNGVLESAVAKQCNVWSMCHEVSSLTGNLTDLCNPHQICQLVACFLNPRSVVRHKAWYFKWTRNSMQKIPQQVPRLQLYATSELVDNLSPISDNRPPWIHLHNSQRICIPNSDLCLHNCVLQGYFQNSPP